MNKPEKPPSFYLKDEHGDHTNHMVVHIVYYWELEKAYDELHKRYSDVLKYNEELQDYIKFGKK